MGIRIDQARHTLILLNGDDRITKYLAGESIRAEGENGWVLVTVEGFPLGWGKRVNQIVKNYYPKGLRH
jgi:NOL1/NOP2/fmu family ribosome biogenesis protein